MERINIQDREVVATLSWVQIPQSYIEIAMLMEGVATAVTIYDQQGTKVVLIQAPQNADKSRCQVRQLKPDVLEINIPNNQLGYLAMTILRGYQAGIFSGSHIHLEGVLDGKEYDLTFMFDKHL